MAHIEDSFYQDIIIPSFRDTYPYIGVTDQVIIQAIREVEQYIDENTPLEVILDRMQDYILSQGLAEYEEGDTIQPTDNI